MAFAAAVFSIAAQDTTAILDLTKRETFNKCTQFSNVYERDSYQAWGYNNYSDYPYMYNYNLTEPYYADYLLSPEIELTAGTLYRLEMSPAAYNSGKTTKLTVGVGQGDDMSTYTVIKQLDAIPYANLSTAQENPVEFNVPATGKYKIYFLGETNCLSLYKTRLISLGTSSVPAAVADLQVLPAPDGSGSATVMFSMPTLSVSGQIIDGQMTYRIYREPTDTPIRSGRAMAGEVISYVDNDVEEGNVTYSVEIISGQDTSPRASATTYIGPETPGAVTALSMTPAASGYTITWTAPDKGIHGAIINPDLLTYQISRVVNGEATIIADAHNSTSFTDNYTSSELCKLHYTVVARLGNELSEAASTSDITVGSVDLPFADSFAGASFGNMWTAEAVKGNYNWMAVAENPFSTQSPKVEGPYDGDGGFAFYNSWTSARGNSARLITAPIRNVAGCNPVVEFFLCHSNYGNDAVKLQVSSDNGEWIDVPDASAPMKGEALKWEKYTFPIADVIADGASTFRVALVADCQNGHNLVIDKVRVFNLAGKDLEASVVSAPEEVVSGNTIPLTFAIANNGATAVSAADYSLEMVTDFPSGIELPATVDIASLDLAQITVNVPLTAIETNAADSYSFALKVNYTGDENVANNISSVASVAVRFLDLDAPESARAEQCEDGSVKITWTPAGDPDYAPLNVATSFEGFDDDFTGPFDGFVSIDLDEDTSGGTYYTTNGSAFNIITRPNTPGGYDGDKCIGLTLGANKQQNDWLISPALNCPEGSTMNFSFMVATRVFSSSSYYYTIDVLYATDDYDPANPAQAFTHKIATKTSSQNYGDFRNSETFSTLSFTDIPAEAKYIALYFKSKISVPSAIWIDNIRIQENILNPLLGYNVYEAENARLNEETIAPAVTEYIDNSGVYASGRRFFVTAVYPDGESNPSEYSSMITSVEEFDADGTVVYATAEGLVITGVKTPVDVYDLNGRHIASVKADALLRLAPAVYVVRSNSQTKKIIVK